MPHPLRVALRAGSSVNALLPEALYRALADEAQRRHVSMAAIVRWALEEYLARRAAEAVSA